MTLIYLEVVFSSQHSHSAKNSHRKGREGRKGKRDFDRRVRGERRERRRVYSTKFKPVYFFLCELCVLCGRFFWLIGFAQEPNPYHG